jgi:host factor-I protein
MESGNPQVQTDESQLNIQNDYFNTARKNRTRVTVVLTTGQRISGMIRSFDRFTLILDTRFGDQMVFKHAIVTVAPAQAMERDQRGGRPQKPGERPDGRGRGAGRPPRPGGPPPAPAREGGGKGGVKERAVHGPQGKSFGNFMDLSAVSGPGEKAPGRSAAPDSMAGATASSEAASGTGPSKPEGPAAAVTSVAPTEALPSPGKAPGPAEAPGKAEVPEKQESKGGDKRPGRDVPAGTADSGGAGEA